MKKIAINGLGRIGRLALRVAFDKHRDGLQIAAVNVSSGTDLEGWKWLLKYDSVYGEWKREIRIQNTEDGIQNKDKTEGRIIIDGVEIPVFSEKEVENLPWGNLRIDTVLECTGTMRTKEKLKQHLKAGAKRVILSAPAAEGESIETVVLSVSDLSNLGNLISNASCTTNCIAPVVKIINDSFGVEKAMMTTAHAATSDQRLLDGSHKDYRRARSALNNIIPTSTGASKAAALVIPELRGKFTGLSLRVPVVCGSIADITLLLKQNVTVDQINQALEQALRSPIYNSIVAVSADPLVSSDIIGRTESAIVDLSLTQVCGGNLIKVVAWYDNEWAYANRLVELAEILR